MTVLLADTIVDRCFRELVVSAAQDMGVLAGVNVSVGDYMVTGKTEVPLEGYQVLVVPLPRKAGIAATTTPALQSGGWISAAWVAYSPGATCDSHWKSVIMHEFGHVYGLSDTRNNSRSLMSWSSIEGRELRPWELAHLRRRIFNAP